MFLRNLRLQNIRSIGEIEVPFGADTGGRKWTYMLGENGTGKSSVLRAIGLALAGSDAAAEVVAIPGTGSASAASGQHRCGVRH